MLRAPLSWPIDGNLSKEKEDLPILLNLHGAGLEADDDQVCHMLDPVTSLVAWVVFPTGGTPWSGDDWRESVSRSSAFVVLMLA